jgi:hypothetical protein
LKLLEQHHQRLSDILRIPLERTRANPPAENDAHATDEKAADGPATAPADSDATAAKPDHPELDGSLASEKNPQALPILSKQQRYPSRDLGASIANNLASARGIRSKYRSQPLTPSVSNAEAPGNLQTTPRRSASGSKSKMQSMIENADKPSGASSPRRVVSRQGSMEQPTESAREPARQRQSQAPNPANLPDEGFSKFYSAFGNIINRISAPLAFAGLPLINEDLVEEPAPPPEPTPPKRNRLKSSPSPSVLSDPDLSKIYSKATLRAISRDGHSATDSFYVVPPSGHTASYASILSYENKEKRRLGASVQGDLPNVTEDPDEDDFVDARESQAPPSPGLKRKTGKVRSDREAENVIEELYVENKSLKDMLDKLSKRLHAFESMSQTSGMRLAESMRLMAPGSPAASATSKAASSPSVATDDELRRRNQELEKQVLAYSAQMEELQRDYNKARSNLIRYREKWEQLKAGAKARRAGGTSASSEAAAADDAATKSSTVG